jgi:pimeloyl-ACP methyl ester carboxylesterase
MPEPLPLHPSSPPWFRRALAVPFTDGWVDVGDAPIHYLAWGDPDRRGLVFVHGGGAHAHWWTHVAATFADDFRVLAVDLSGHGDSGHRDEYALEQWTDEVLAVAADGGIEGLPVIVGHSMGGFVTIATAALHPDRVTGVVVCDSPVTSPYPG